MWRTNWLRQDILNEYLINFPLINCWIIYFEQHCLRLDDFPVGDNEIGCSKLFWSPSLTLRSRIVSARLWKAWTVEHSQGRLNCCWRWCWWGEWKKDTCATLTPVRALVSKKAMECSRAKASPRSLSTCTNMITKVEMTIATSLLPSRSALLPRRIKGTPGKPNSSMLPSHLPIPEKLTDMHVTNKLTNNITCWTG